MPRTLLRRMQYMWLPPLQRADVLAVHLFTGQHFAKLRGTHLTFFQMKKSDEHCFALRFSRLYCDAVSLPRAGGVMRVITIWFCEGHLAIPFTVVFET